MVVAAEETLFSLKVALARETVDTRPPPVDMIHDHLQRVAQTLRIHPYLATAMVRLILAEDDRPVAVLFRLSEDLVHIGVIAERELTAYLRAALLLSQADAQVQDAALASLLSPKYA